MENNSTQFCLNCGKSENEVPVIEIRFSGNKGSLCSQCIPIMIHNPEKMAAELIDLSKKDDSE